MTAIAQAAQPETWHAISTSPGWERRVVDALHEAGFAPYLPQTTETIIRKGRKRTRTRLVIPSYVFVRLAAWADKWGAINRHDMEGVGKMITNHGRPSPIPQAQMDRVQACSDDEEQILAWLIKAGKVVRVSNRQKRRDARFRRHLARQRAV